MLFQLAGHLLHSQLQGFDAVQQTNGIQTAACILHLLTALNQVLSPDDAGSTLDSMRQVGKPGQVMVEKETCQTVHVLFIAAGQISQQVPDGVLVAAGQLFQAGEVYALGASHDLGAQGVGQDRFSLGSGER